MRNVFIGKAPSPRFVEVSKNNFKTESKNIILKINKSNQIFVVKPCDSMGARGCRMVLSPDELFPALKKAMKYSRTERAIVEDYMDGNEYSIDALVSDGELTITGFADRHIFYPPFFIEMGHTMPSKVCEKEKKEIFKVLLAGVKALGLSHGAVKADIKVTSKGPMIGEIAARLSGGYMSGWTYPYASGLNVTKQALLLALNEKPTELLTKRKALEGVTNVYEVPCVRVSAERAWVSIPGIVQSVENLSSARSVAGVKDVFSRLKKGDTVCFPQNNVEKAGNVITCLQSRQEAVQACKTAIKKIFVRLVLHSPETEKFLKQPLKTLFPPSAYPDAAGLSLREARVKEEEDWNGLTIKETLEILPQLVRINVPEHDKNFLQALYRGGLQGAVYYCETMDNN